MACVVWSSTHDCENLNRWLGASYVDSPPTTTFRPANGSSKSRPPPLPPNLSPDSEQSSDGSSEAGQSRLQGALNSRRARDGMLVLKQPALAVQPATVSH